MADIRERKIASPDLDIFGDDVENEEATDREADANSMDIFGEDAEEAKAEGEAAADASAGEAGEAEGEGPDWDSIFGASDEVETKEEEAAEGNEAEGGEKLDPELEALLKDVSNAEEKDERDDVIADLRQKLVDKQIENDALTRHKEVLNEKLMNSSTSDTELGLYRETIAKLEENPKLRALVKFFGSEDEKAKGRVTTVLADLLETVTGQDVSGLLDKSRTDKTKAALGAQSSASPAGKSKDSDEPMDYEESVSALW